MVHGHPVHGPWFGRSTRPCWPWMWTDAMDHRPCIVRLLIAFALAWTGASATPSGQEPEAKPTFSTESEVVVLHVAVKDRKGGYVAGLPQESFRVLEDRRPQEITFFNSQDAPVTVGLLIDS